MEFVQDLLTAATQIIAIAGMTGIIAHAMWTHHCNWMATYCPPVAPYTPDTQAEKVEAITLTGCNAYAPVPAVTEPQPEPQSQDLPEPEDEDIWEAPISSSPARYWVRQPITQPVEPVLMLMPALEEKPRRGRKPAQSKTPAKSKATKPATKNTRKRKVA